MCGEFFHNAGDEDGKRIRAETKRMAKWMAKEACPSWALSSSCPKVKLPDRHGLARPAKVETGIVFESLARHFESALKEERD